MNPAGLVIAIAGVWVVCQVMAGNALERLNLLQPKASGGGLLPPGAVPGPDDIKPYLPGGDRNPAVPTFPDIFGQGWTGRYL